MTVILLVIGGLILVPVFSVVAAMLLVDFWCNMGEK